MALRTAATTSGALLNIDDISRSVVDISSMVFSTASPVMASIRRMPAAMELSEMTRIMPIFPVLATCVPPQSSMESP